MFECQKCFFKEKRWQGWCSSCKEKGSLVELVSINKKKEIAKIFSLKEIDFIKKTNHIKSNIFEWDRVLGGGIVPGSCILVCGEPGIGKSTLMLQVANKVSQEHKTIYFSTEESIEQQKHKLKRINLSYSENMFLSQETNVETICETIESNKPALVIIDSLQNCDTQSNKNYSYNSHTQIKECTQRIIHCAKNTNAAIIITGHITKEGFAAGPKLIEHMVDATFYIQKDEILQQRILRSVKNRFGSDQEIGFFQMCENGMNEIEDINKKKILETKNEKNFGLSFSMMQQGSRLILLKIEALCSKTKMSLAQRISNNINQKRILIIIAILEKHLKIKLYEFDIFIKISNEINLNNQYLDLAIALSILSSYYQKSIPPVMAVGEISLSGQINSPSNLEDMIKLSKKLGIEKFITANPKDESLIYNANHIIKIIDFLSNL